MRSNREALEAEIVAAVKSGKSPRAHLERLEECDLCREAATLSNWLGAVAAVLSLLTGGLVAWQVARELG